MTWTFDLAWGTHGNGNGQFQSGAALAVKANGNVLVCDDLRNDYQEFTADGTYVRTNPGGSGQLADPTGGICVSPLNGDIFVGDLTGTRIKQFQDDGTWIRTFGTTGTGNGQFKAISKICCDASGRLYVYDGGTGRKDVQRFTTAGVFDSIFHASTVTGMCYEPNGDLLILSVGAIGGHVYSFNTSGAQVTDFGAVGSFIIAQNIEVVSPYDGFSAGHDGHFYTVGTDMAVSGTYGDGTAGSGAGQFATSDPYDACPSPDGNYVYLADHNNYRIQRWVLSGSVPTSSVAPVASGSPLVGATLACGTGTWTGSPTSYAYQWQDSADGATGWANVTGASNLYGIPSGELGKYLRCHVTATNAGGDSTAATSNVIGPVTNPTSHPELGRAAVAGRGFGF